MIVVTVVGFYGFRRFERTLSKVEPHLPKITAIALVYISMLALLDL
jgi:hypothetical protein